MKVLDRFKWLFSVAGFAIAIAISVNLQSCGDGQSKSEEQVPEPDAEELAVIAKGLDIVGPSQQTLGGQLKKALKSGGVQHAIEYCNEAAFPLVDSLSVEFGATIRRTSLKLRNPMDAPTPEERPILEAFTAKFHAGESMDPIVQELPNGKTGFYSPIMVQEMCLQCHGKIGTDIAQADYDFIRGVYPDDSATGYQAGDFRGMWSVTFSN